MLYQSAVPLSLLEVLRSLQEKTQGTGFALAGGTSLALRFGHRMSVDLDFFTESHFDPQTWADKIGAGPECITGMAAGTLQLILDGVKVEFLRHTYPKLAEHDRINGLALWSLQDVGAMKLNAIANRGSKKDFHDLVALMDLFPLDCILGWYRTKYQPASLMMVVRSLAWFEDAEQEPDPICLNGRDWNEVKDRVSAALRRLE
jgi:hypothetical protein